MLRFFPALFEPAIEAGAPVIPSAVAYELDDGQEVDMCYYGDISFGPHLFKALAHKAVHAKIVFAEGGLRYSDRKTAAAESHEEVLAIRKMLAASKHQPDSPVSGGAGQS